MKLTFIGAGSTIFAKNVLGDIMLTPSIHDMEIALYDLDCARLNESYDLINCMGDTIGGKNKIQKFLGVENRKEALRGADFVVTAIQVGGYEPCTVIDFELPKKYGLKQTIADTLGIGGIFRALRTIPVFEGIARDIESVCPDALLLNYVNPMAMITGYMQRYTGVKTIGLCHSVQCCSHTLLTALGMEDKLEGRKELIAGINHMGWLLEIKDKYGNDLYPEIRRRAREKNATEKHNDMVRFEYINRFGYYCTESSEHNAEYNPFFIKSAYPEYIERYNIPIDEYIRRCILQINDWNEQKKHLDAQAGKHQKSHEYASLIINSVVTGEPYKIGGNVLNEGLIENLPYDACVEVPCLVDGMGIHPTKVGRLPTVLAAMNTTNINVQLCAIEAAVKRKKEYIYHAAMMDPHTAAELSIDDIVKMCNELMEAHGEYMSMYK